MNIERGCVIAAIIGGWVIVPWKILSSASTFLDFMGGYAVFLAPIAGIMASDYWLVKHQNYDVPALYDPNGRYHYWHGVNWRAAVALVTAVVPNLPGLAYSIGTPADPTAPGAHNPVHISAGAKNLYTFDWLFGFVTSIVLYTSLSLIFPAKESLVSETVYGHNVIDGNYTRESDEESTSHQHEKDFGNVDAVDMNLGHSEKGAESHILH